MQGKATIKGHPIHPMLVTVPIGCFVAAAASDVISIWAGPAFWPDMATALVGFGVIGALLAAAFGFIDYLSAPMSQTAKGIAAWHMTLNLGVVIVFGVEWAVRTGDRTTVAGYVLEVLGIVVLAISGVLGGNLAHNHLVGSSEQDRNVEREAADRTAMSPAERATLNRERAERERSGSYRGTL